jgi:hypothetical protein
MKKKWNPMDNVATTLALLILFFTSAAVPPSIFTMLPNLN